MHTSCKTVAVWREGANPSPPPNFVRVAKYQTQVDKKTRLHADLKVKILPLTPTFVGRLLELLTPNYDDKPYKKLILILLGDGGISRHNRASQLIRFLVSHF
jgi:hypothetical protein